MLGTIELKRQVSSYRLRYPARSRCVGALVVRLSSMNMHESSNDCVWSEGINHIGMYVPSFVANQFFVCYNKSISAFEAKSAHHRLTAIDRFKQVSKPFEIVLTDFLLLGLRLSPSRIKRGQLRRWPTVYSGRGVVHAVCNTF